MRIYTIYKSVYRYLVNFYNRPFKIEGKEYLISYSLYCFKEWILLKWMIEVENFYIINYTKKLENFNHMLNCLANANDILVQEISSIIQNVVNTEPDLNFDSLGSRKATKLDCMFVSSSYSCYEFGLDNNKRYTIKMFDLEEYNNLPPGLSTTYLNYKDGFEILGYMAIMKISKQQYKYIFISVEEKLDFFSINK